jgi:hypothetical protein
MPYRPGYYSRKRTGILDNKRLIAIRFANG